MNRRSFLALTAVAVLLRKLQWPKEPVGLVGMVEQSPSFAGIRGPTWDDYETRFYDRVTINRSAHGVIAGIREVSHGL